MDSIFVKSKREKCGLLLLNKDNTYLKHIVLSMLLLVGDKGLP